MEKDYNCLFTLKYQNLLQRIQNGVRDKARGVPAFRESGNGCIRITLVPLSELAEAWLGGGLSDFGNFPDVNVPDICEREFTCRIRPGGSYTIQWKDPEDGHVEPVNCCAYSAMKVAFAAWEQEFFRDRLPEGASPADTEVEAEYRSELTYRTEENGWSSHKGPAYATVTLDDEEFLRIWVCVSGAESKQDEQCALWGLFQAQEFFYGATEAVRQSCFPDGICNATLNFQMKPDFVNIQNT